MKMFFEFFPIILFFTVFKFKGIYAATAVAIGAGFIQLIYVYLKKRKIEPMLLISVLVLTVFGGFTIFLHNEMFIKWKPTIVYWIFAVVLGTAQIAFKKNLIKLMLQEHLIVPEKVWVRLNISWIVFFTAVGALNLYVMSNFSTSAWVNFKLFGLMGCMFIFIIGQSIFLSSYMKDNAQNKEK
ncbi:MAG: septation protein A [Elusimicrobia bacterium]|nr:septation protein A [Elusimicrobiota bacterium]